VRGRDWWPGGATGRAEDGALERDGTAASWIDKG